MGSTRTAEEIARNLPDASVLESSAAHRISRQLPARPTVVVATPGAEPDVDGGYAAAIILDAHALAGRTELWAPEEAARRWLNATPLAGAASMLAVLTDIRRSRSARKVPLVKMSVNPPELF